MRQRYFELLIGSCKVRRMTLYHHDIHAEHTFQKFLKDSTCDCTNKRMNLSSFNTYIMGVQPKSSKLVFNNIQRSESDICRLFKSGKT